MNKINKKTHVQNAAEGGRKLILGAIFSRLISFSSIYFVVMLYSPESIGEYNVIWAHANILGALMSLRLGVAIIRHGDEKDKIQTLKSGVLVVSLLTILLAAVVFLTSMTGFIEASSIFTFLLVIFGGAAISILDIMTSYLASIRCYTETSRAGIIQSLCGETSKFIFSISSSPYSLIGAQVIGYVAGACYCLRRIGFIKLKGLTSLTAAKNVLGRNFDIIGIRTFAHVLMMIGIQLPIILSSYFLESFQVGQISIALMAVAVPFSIIGQSASKAFYVEASAIGKSKFELSKLIKSVASRQMIIGCMAALSGFMFFQPIFNLAFGESWNDAGMYASIICLSIPLQLAAGSVIEVANILTGQSFFLKIYAKRILIVSVTLFVAYYAEFEMTGLAYAYVTALNLHFATNLLACIKLVHRSGK